MPKENENLEGRMSQGFDDIGRKIHVKASIRTASNFNLQLRRVAMQILST